MTEQKFTRPVKEFGNMGKVLITSKDLYQFVGENVEITVRRQNHDN